MAKALGAEILDFYQNGWPDGYYIDDYEIDPDEPDSIEPTKKYDLDDFGCLYRHDEVYAGADAISFASAFQKWKRTRTHLTFMVNIPKEHEDAFKEFIKMIKGKISK